MFKLYYTDCYYIICILASKSTFDIYERVDKDLIEQYKQEIQEGNNGQKSSYAEIEVINKKEKKTKESQ